MSTRAKWIPPLLLLSNLIFLATSVNAAEFSCPDGGAAMDIQYGDFVNCSLESVGDLDVYAIAATEGDFISVNVTYTGSDDCGITRFSLRGLDENSEELDRSSSNSCNGTDLGTRIEFKVKKTGTHTVTISDIETTFSSDSKLIGEYQVEFQCVSGSCISQALLPKQECTASFDGSVFEVPYIEFSDKVFTANFKVISGNPLQFELTTVGEK